MRYHELTLRINAESDLLSTILKLIEKEPNVQASSIQLHKEEPTPPVPQRYGKRNENYVSPRRALMRGGKPTIQAILLQHLKQNHNTTLQRLGDAIALAGYTASSASPAVSHLERQGYVIHERDDVLLTLKGETYIATLEFPKT